MKIDVPSGSAWSRFWFTPIPTTGYHVLRLLSGLLFCTWLLSFLGHQQAFFSFNGWLDLSAFQEARQQQNTGLPPIGWSILYWAGESASAFTGLYWGSVAVLVLFALGVATRVTGVLTWVVVVSFLANPVTSWEGDYLLAILAFHLMLGHLFLGLWNGDLSFMEKILGSRHDFLFARLLWPRRDELAVSYAANWSMRMIQIHFTIIVLTSALHKLQIDDWWAGAALWYPLHPAFLTTAASMEAEKPTAAAALFILSLVQYAILAWQIAFPMFAWRRGTVARTLLLGGAILGWLGIRFIFKAPLFGPFLFIGCLSFLGADEWARVKALAGSLLRGSREGKAMRETAKSTAFTAKANVKK